MMKFLLIVVLLLLSDMVAAQDENKLAYDVQWSPDGKWIDVVGDGGIQIYDTSDFTKEPLVWGEEQSATTFAFDPLRPRVAVALGSEEIEIFDLETGEMVESVYAPMPEEEYFPVVYNIEYSDDGRFLAVTNTRIVSLFDAETGEEQQIYDLPTSGDPYGLSDWVTSLEFGENSTTLFTVDWGSDFFELSAGSSTVQNDVVLDEPYKIERMELISERELMVYKAGNYLYQYDMESGDKTVLFGSEEQSVDGFALSADEEEIAIGVDNRWVLYQVESGEVTGEYESDFRESDSFMQVFALSFSPENDRVVTLQTDGQIKVWDVESGEVVAELGDYTHAVSYKWG